LKFWSELKTPAMQAGLATRHLTFREVLMSVVKFVRLTLSIFPIPWGRQIVPAEI
jgi:hypothetical protein